MIAFLDAAYSDDRAAAACVCARDWTDAAPSDEHALTMAAAAPYEPGAFYRRELPLLLAILQRAAPPSAIVIDGYVQLGDKPGLGAHLFDAVRVPIIGIAKTPFRDAPVLEVLRGASARPLLVTAQGMPLTAAGDRVRAMHGPHRVPTLPRRADALARAALRGGHV